MGFDNGYAVIVPVYTVLVMVRMSSMSGIFGKLQNHLTGKMKFPASRVGSVARPGLLCPTTRLGDNNGQMASWNEIQQDAEAAMDTMISSCSKQGFKITHDKEFWNTPRDVMEFSAVRDILNKTLQDQIDNGHAVKGGPFGLPAIIKPDSNQRIPSLLNYPPQNSHVIMPNMISNVNSPSLIPTLQIHKKELDHFTSKIEKMDVTVLAQTDFEVLSLGPAKSEILVNHLQNSLQQSMINLSELDEKCLGREAEIARMKKFHKLEMANSQNKSVSSSLFTIQSEPLDATFGADKDIRYHSTPVPNLMKNRTQTDNENPNPITVYDITDTEIENPTLNDDFSNIQVLSQDRMEVRTMNEVHGDILQNSESDQLSASSMRTGRKRSYRELVNNEEEISHIKRVAVANIVYGDLSCLDDL